MTQYGFKCQDIGMKCGFAVQGSTSKDEVLQIAAVHAKHAHQITNVTPELAGKIAGAVRS